MIKFGTSHPSRILREPFRIFFVIGFLAGLAGVLIWHLYHTQMISQFSGVMHARFQIQGFLGSFAVGFLLTAIPRLMGVKPCTWWELVLLLALFGINIVCQWRQNPLWGDVAFFVILILLVSFAIKRFFSREDLPPPFFVLVPIGIFHALTGLGCLIWSESHPSSAILSTLGKNLFNQGFFLNLILGIGSFLGPRLLGFAKEMPWVESRSPPPGWWTKSFFFLGIGSTIFLSFFVEALGWERLGQVMRALAASFVIVGRMQVYRTPAAPGFLPRGLQAALIFVLIGLWGLPLFPVYRVAILHILFIGGFSLITFIVATRVILGHSGFEHLFGSRMLFIGFLTLFIMGGLIFRVAADFHPEKFFSFLNVASLLWMTGSLIWAVMVFPKIIFPRPEEEAESSS